jgi:hypothetical protein
MKVIRSAVLCALVAGGSIGLAATASADPLDGAYTLVVTDGRAIPGPASPQTG